MQLDYVFSPSEIPVPVSNPIVDENCAVIGLASADSYAGMGLARAKVSKSESFSHDIRLSWLQKWEEDPCLVSHRNLISFIILALVLLYWSINCTFTCSVLWRKARLFFCLAVIPVTLPF
jgi:hypothetical protein